MRKLTLFLVSLMLAFLVVRCVAPSIHKPAPKTVTNGQPEICYYESGLLVRCE